MSLSLGTLGPAAVPKSWGQCNEGRRAKDTETTVDLGRHHSQMFWFSLLPMSTFDVFIARQVYLGQSERKKDLVTD